MKIETDLVSRPKNTLETDLRLGPDTALETGNAVSAAEADQLHGAASVVESVEREAAAPLAKKRERVGPVSAEAAFEISNRPEVVMRKAWSAWYRQLPPHFRALDQRVAPFLTQAISAEPFPWLRAARRALMLTTETAASRAGVSRNAFSQVERSEIEGAVTLETLRKYADALECDVIFALRPRACVPFSDVVWA